MPRNKIISALLGFILGIAPMAFSVSPASSRASAAPHPSGGREGAARASAALRYRGLDPERYVTRSWNTGSGLPHNNVRALARTADGYLWVGTPAGLVRFDGVRSTLYNQWNTPVLKNNSILCLYEDRNAVLWIGTDGGGLYAYEDGEWKSLGERFDLANGHIRAVTGDLRGNLWIGTEYGLHRLSGGEMQVYGLDDGLADNLITALAADASGRLWAGTMRGGLARFEDGFVQMYDFDDGLGNLTVLSLSAGPADSIWIGTMDGLYHLRSDDGPVRPVDRTAGRPVTSLAAGPEGALLIGTMVEGPKLLAGSSAVDLLPGHADSYVHSVLIDRDGYIWIGTESDGLMQVRERTAGSITARDGLPEGAVYALLEDDDGALWIGTESSGLWRMRGGRISRALDRSRGLAGDMVRSLMMDRSGGLWVGTMDGGLSILTDGRVRNLTVDDGLASDNVTSILQDGSGAVWIGTDRGLDRCENGAIGESGAHRALEGLAIRALYENGDGVLYACTRSGVWRRSGSSFARVDEGPGDGDFDVLSLHEDGGGTLWMGTNGGGLERMSEGAKDTFTTADGLPGDFIYSIREDDAGFLWFGCEAGVFRISRDSLDAYADGAVRIIAPALYDDSDGMPSARCSGFCQPAVCESRSGKILYPTTAGIAVIEAGRESGTARPPSVRIESILADDVPLQGKGGAGLSHKTDRIEIRFTAFDYSAPGRCRFIYRLGGYDSASTALHPPRRRSAVYRDLPPGEYEFTVRAVGDGGLWSENAAVARFVIVPPFYRKRAFPAAVAAAAVLIGGSAAASLRYRKIRKQKMKYSTMAMDAERMERALADLNTLMEEEKVFLDPDLTLEKLARRLKIHYNHLSRIINERFGMSFNNYVNRYRIGEAQKRLADPAQRNRTILDIMFDAGFYSKSTFNTAFKKFAGTSPSRYRRRHG